MNHLSALLGLAPKTRVLVLGSGDLDLEAALVAAIEAPAERSAAGIEVDEDAFDLVVIGREAAADRSLRRAFLAAAARAVKPGGLVAAEFPNRLPLLSPLLLAYEGLTESPPMGGGLRLEAAQNLCRGVGFVELSSFLSLPSLADPKVVLPLDSPPAAAFHFRPPFFVETFQRQCLRRALGLVAAWGSLALMSPTFAILARRETT